MTRAKLQILTPSERELRWSREFDAVLRTGFEAGVEASFERLASTIAGL